MRPVLWRRNSRRTSRYIEQFRTDAKCAFGYIILAGSELSTGCCFSLNFGPDEAPYLFKVGGESQWASTSAELLALLYSSIKGVWMVGAQSGEEVPWVQIYSS